VGFFISEGAIVPNIDKETQKAAVKEALQEWLDKQFVALGKWSLGGIISMGLVVMTYLFLTQSGWHK
jgi:hypothetical protein